MSIEFNPIGVIHSPFTEPKGTPIQPAGAADVEGSIEVFPEFVTGLADLGGFSHIMVFYHLHRSTGFSLSVVPYLDTQPRGLFATRAPRRPNPLGVSVVRLLAVDGGTLQVLGVDMLDGSPLLDIKPYVPQFDAPGEVRTGWLAEVQARARDHKADGRFG